MRTKSEIIALVKNLPALIGDHVHLNAVEAFDGAWAPQTKAALERLECTSFNLSPLWLLTPQNWRCPICERSKLSILRASEGVLLGRIVEHHDHIDQFIENATKSAAATLGIAPSEDVYRHLRHRCAPFLHRFQPTTICEDCNNADPAAMAHCRDSGAGLDFFSFSPMEISAFIIPQLGQKHKINLDKAKALLDQQRETHHFRLKVGETLVTRALEGRCWAEMPKGLGRHEVIILANEALIELEMTVPGLQMEATPRRAIERIQAFKMTQKNAEENLEAKRERTERRAARRAERKAQKAAGPAPNQGKSWTKEDEVELLALYRRDIPIGEVAQKLGRKQGGIRSRLKLLGIEAP